MRIVRALAAILAGLALQLGTPPAEAARRCKAIDGDTVRCGRERIRLREVYAAERGAPGAESQRRALQRQLDSGDVRIRRHGKDAFGRTLGDVYVDGRRISQADVGPAGGKGAERRQRQRAHAGAAGDRP